MKCTELLDQLESLLGRYGDKEVYFNYDNEPTRIIRVKPIPKPRYTVHDPIDESIGAFLLNPD